MPEVVIQRKKGFTAIHNSSVVPLFHRVRCTEPLVPQPEVFPWTLSPPDISHLLVTQNENPQLLQVLSLQDPFPGLSLALSAQLEGPLCSEPMGLLPTLPASHHLRSWAVGVSSRRIVLNSSEGTTSSVLPLESLATSSSFISPETGQCAVRWARNSCCFDKGYACLTFCITRVSQEAIADPVQVDPQTMNSYMGCIM